jgi:hypothetical protein
LVPLRGGASFRRCPFHDDREPSLVVTPEKNLWHCLGACQTGGSVIDRVMRTRGVSFRHAVELLKADHPSLAALVDRPVKKSTTAKIEPPVWIDSGDQEVLGQVVAYYHETLKQSPEALRYLESRGLADPEMIDRFNWASPTPKWCAATWTRPTSASVARAMFRHTMATLMLEGAADIRFIQAMLGHADLKTTQVYTHVAIRQLQEIHRATHPAKLERDKREIQEKLEAEEAEDV